MWDPWLQKFGITGAAVLLLLIFSVVAFTIRAQNPHPQKARFSDVIAMLDDAEAHPEQSKIAKMEINGQEGDVLLKMKNIDRTQSVIVPPAYMEIFIEKATQAKVPIETKSIENKMDLSFGI